MHKKNRSHRQSYGETRIDFGEKNKEEANGKDCSLRVSGKSM